MGKLGFVVALAVLLVAGVWVIRTPVANAQVDGKDINILVMDDCLPGDLVGTPRVAVR